ncbi:MAG: yxlF 2 [Pedosphaera sp.]|nr:yxlF 2 [Pedosphaera sp.]
MGRDNIIVFNRVTKVFGGFLRGPRITAVDNVSFAIQRGEIFGLLGPDASGVSTMLKLIKGLIEPDRGDIQVLGAPAWANTIATRVGYVAAESGLDPRLGCMAALAPKQDRTGLSLIVRTKRAHHLLEIIGLPGTMKQAVGELSAGTQRCITLAQGLMLDPDLLLVDQPFRGLDALEAGKVNAFIHAIAKAGKTIVFTSRWLLEAGKICNRVAVCSQGRLQAQGTIPEILAAPEGLQAIAPILSLELRQRALRLICEELAGQGISTGIPSPISSSHPTGTGQGLASGEMGAEQKRLLGLMAADLALVQTAVPEPKAEHAPDLNRANERLSSLLPEPARQPDNLNKMP